jgi:hypothetical protein
MKSMAAIAALITFVLIGPVPVRAQDAETVLVNGKIVTVDGRFAVREALAVRDGKIAAIGAGPEM